MKWNKLMNNTVFLSNDEMIKIIKEFRKTKDEKLQDKIIRANIKFINSFALRYRNSCDYDDLMIAGCLGVCRAMEKFNLDDNTVGVNFLNYSAWWIRNKINRLVYRKRQTVSSATKILSMDNEFGDNGSMTLHDILETDTENNIYGKDEHHRIVELIALLPPDEQLVINARFGIGQGKKTLQSLIGDTCLTREAIRVKQHRIMKKLYDMFVE